MFPLQALAGYVTDHIWAFFAAVVSLIGAAFLTYAREQISTGTEWTLSPLTRLLPWNSPQKDKKRGGDDLHQLRSEFSLVDIFIFNASGEKAVYRKISRFRVLGQELLAYQEGVTAEGRADEFASMRGTILRTAPAEFTLLERLPRGPAPLFQEFTRTLDSGIGVSDGDAHPPNSLPF